MNRNYILQFAREDSKGRERNEASEGKEAEGKVDVGRAGLVSFSALRKLCEGG